MRKRQKFVFTAILLSAAIVGIQFLSLELRYITIGLLTAATWVLSAWSLKEGLAGIEWLTVLLPMCLFSAGVGFFFILLPPHWLAKLAIILLFGIGQYALLLTSNIFSVAAIRTIALLRAAQAVGFVMTLLTGFFVYNTILSFRQGFWVNGPIVAAVSILMLLPALWSVKLEERMSKQLITFCLTMAVLVGLMSMAISFWPVSLAVSSLFLTTLLYVYLGIAQHYFSERLYRKTALEYITVGMVVLVTMLLTSGGGV
jgi:hypothetical protein